MLTELHPGRSHAGVDLDSDLERELGLDSLSRTELLARLERHFGVNLPNECLTAASPRELLHAIRTADKVATQPPAPLPRTVIGPAASGEPLRATTLVEVLQWHAETHPERIYLYLYENGFEPHPIAYGELLRQAQQTAVGLRAAGLHPGETAAIMLPTGRDYFFVFFGILLAGATPVPIYPPVRPAQVEEHLRRHTRILDNAGVTLLITVPEAKTVARLLRARTQSLRAILTPKELRAMDAELLPAPKLRADAMAFLQYTSGSTGDPKGVVLTHANLLANIRAMGRRVQVRPDDVFVSWLPLYHDMGLIGAALGTLYYGFPLAVMSPLDFLRRPLRWLQAIHRHRGTISAAPNFAFELCLRHIEERDLQSIDLSSWRLALSGAEPVSVSTIRSFGERFAPYGLRPEALAPVYGLAECSVGLALPLPGRGLRVDRIRSEAFAHNGQAQIAAADEQDVLECVACGHVIPDHEIRIVDHDGRILPERREGRLQFRGPSATSGYYRNAEATRKLFDGDWLESGDRAYMADGDVFITGRVKDLIIRGGRNLYPYELEQAVGNLPGVRAGCVAVFASRSDNGTERLVVVAETRVQEQAEREVLHKQVQQICIDVLGAPPDDIVLAPPHAVLKTSSGKIRRTAVRKHYERGDLGRSDPLWRQLGRSLIVSVGPQLRRWLRNSGEALYAAYAWLAFLLPVPLLWLALYLLPQEPARALSRSTVRVLGRILGIRWQVQGLEHLPQAGACVFAVNHTSYLDALILTAVLPRSFAFVAKIELAQSALMRIPLQGLGTIFVERFDLARSTADAERVARAVAEGEALLFFPEGTFGSSAGLLPFRMGAFIAAAQAATPVVPITLRGARALLPVGSWRLRRGAVHIQIDEPILPQGKDWAAAVQVRDRVREVILRRCGDPDLAD